MDKSQKHKLFLEKNIDEQRKLLQTLINPVVNKSPVFEKLLKIVEITKDSGILVTILDKILEISKNIAERRKKEGVESFKQDVSRIEQIHKAEELENNLDKKDLEELEDLLNNI